MIIPLQAVMEGTEWRRETGYLLHFQRAMSKLYEKKHFFFFILLVKEKEAKDLR